MHYTNIDNHHCIRIIIVIITNGWTNKKAYHISLIPYISTPRGNYSQMREEEHIEIVIK
jgi:hypothetical protein